VCLKFRYKYRRRDNRDIPDTKSGTLIYPRRCPKDREGCVVQERPSSHQPNDRCVVGMGKFFKKRMGKKRMGKKTRTHTELDVGSAIVQLSLLNYHEVERKTV
jgi:hypothetical protein